MRPCCPKYTTEKVDPSTDMLIYKVAVAVPGPPRTKRTISWSDHIEDIPFKKNDAPIKVSEMARAKIRKRMPTGGRSELIKPASWMPTPQ